MKTISITRLAFVAFAINLMLLLTTIDGQRRSGVGKTSAPPIRRTASVPRAGTVVRNRIGMELVYVPAGSFMMGSTSGGNNRRPIHQVTIREGFYMSKHEVTQAQWQAVMGSNPSLTWSNPSSSIGDNLPVVQVSWNDAQEFIRKLNVRNDGYTYRLPSEAEWEYACRAGTTGDYAGNLDAMAWYDKNSGGKTHPVGQKQPNAFGLYDMHGNAYEWCEDWYHENYNGAPVNGSAWLSGGKQEYRVFRGGSQGNEAPNLRSASRYGNYPGFRGNGLGLRVVAVSRAS